MTKSSIFFFFLFAFVLQNLQHVNEIITCVTAAGSGVISPAINILKAFQPIRFLSRKLQFWFCGQRLHEKLGSRNVFKRNNTKKQNPVRGLLASDLLPS